MSAPFVILTYLYLSSIKSFFSPSKCDSSNYDLFFNTKSQQRLRGIFLHSCPMFFSARNVFLSEQIDMSQERMQLSELSLQLVNQILARRLGA